MLHTHIPKTVILHNNRYIAHGFEPFGAKFFYIYTLHSKFCTCTTPCFLALLLLFRHVPVEFSVLVSFLLKEMWVLPPFSRKWRLLAPIISCNKYSTLHCLLKADTDPCRKQLCIQLDNPSNEFLKCGHVQQLNSTLLDPGCE